MGTFLGVTKDKHGLLLQFEGFEVLFREGSIEAEILKERLSGAEIGCRIGILKTDNARQPIRIRIERDGSYS